ncbi:MAG: hypothetical protein CFH18_00218 [Alphaproteobacteria bacterium MarineAlpha5_Bin8]|nr:MAG: hypothetical protein CFH17_00957 [Alphaproteobacteria bacterium MarineAlpha5_Bin7]PPR48155.1 MAG: hypothetical protein CFH18_00218 [Alphaproteobacteria bacterium MarineAlpha5_Bin8]PPR54730.1 MAG: hypothetical protein CFH16_00179 [Alphaproteobacteria bacterium MarineAlpha5_Bin6]|tara:strand:- start:9685 stop:10986 length:1302 start_codon:yes stop_codon:yes gene_type:complete
MYNPFFKFFIIILFTFIISCAPQNFVNNTKQNKIEIKTESDISTKKIEADNNSSKLEENIKKINYSKNIILNEIEIILPKHENDEITNDFINAFELSLYKKGVNNIKFNINRYEDKKDLEYIVDKKSKPGKIFIGPLTSSYTKDISKKCSKGIIFFSFGSNRNHAGDCVYLINFFPEDDLKVLFDSFEKNSKIALLYPENDYGYYINSIIDNIALKSNSIIINRASYNINLTNAREAIKELSKYELRKYELERQKEILKNKDDEVSKRALKKIKNFETAGIVEFTHIILPDYSLRLLQIAPLLPFYDIDPNKIQFVGTGVWDDEAFFYEPSLQNSIFPGILEKKRKNYMNDFYINYKKQPPRTITIPYDLVGILEYIINNKLNLEDLHKLLDNNLTSFDGIDGQFTFNKNIITRKLNVLKISNGKADLFIKSQ